MINVKGFYIFSPGDPSVGIFSTYWELVNGFSFNDQEELEDFRKALKDAFEYVADDVYIETFEEREEILKQENKMWEGIEKEEK